MSISKNVNSLDLQNKVKYNKLIVSAKDKFLLELKDIGKIYDTNNIYTIGVRHINLRLNLNEFVTIEGESGSGKSTLLNVIASNDTYEEGEMYFKGVETSHYSEQDWDKYRENNISFIFQDFNILENLTALENVELALFYMNNVAERREKAKELIKRVGLEQQMNQRASQLSGGEKQRTVIARALAKNSPIILADEPTGNLDSKSAEGIAELLKEISADKLVIVVTHNAEYFEKYATRKIRIHDGTIVSDENVSKEETKSTEWREDTNRTYNVKKNVFWLGSLNYKSRPKFTILMSAILLTFSIALFAIISIFADQIRKPLTQPITTNPINGKTIVKNVDGKEIGEHELEKIVRETKANFVFKNNEYSEIVAKLETLDGRQKNITFLYDPYRYNLKGNECVLYVSHSLAHNINYIKAILKALKIDVSKIKIKKTLKQNTISVYCSRETMYRYGEVLKSLNSEVEIGNRKANIFRYKPVKDLEKGHIRLVNLKYWIGETNKIFLNKFGSKAYVIDDKDKKDSSELGTVIEMNEEEYNEVFMGTLPESSEIALYYKNNAIAKKRLTKLNSDYMYLFSNDKIYLPDAADSFIYDLLAYIGLIVAGILIGVLVSIIFSKNVGVLSNDFAIYRTLGISRQHAKMSLYIQMLFIFLPNIILLPFLSLIATVIPNSIVKFISPVNYLVIELMMFSIVEVVALRFNRKIFKTSIRKSLSRGSK